MAARRAKLVAQGIAIGLVALLFLLLVWALATEKGGDLAKAANAGELPEAPDFTLDRLEKKNGELTLSSLHGKPVVVNMWASWCLPCKEEAPTLEQAWRRNRAGGVVFVGVATKDFRRDARRFAEKYGVTYPVVLDGPGDLWGPYGILGLPETFVLDREGRVVEAIIGAVNTDEDRARLNAAIRRASRS
jgi:cytochrome c biogenesis protein CcmG/thiol:disulfide interchange protein DsbE